MKTVFLLLFSVSFFTTHAQNCLPSGITLSTQTEVNNFPINYPGCVFIQGNLTIGKTGTPSTITDLTPLTQLTGIGGRLIVTNNGNLQTLNGLQNITQIQNTSQFYDITIQSNPSLTSLINFPAAINNSIQISNNGISSLNGLSNVAAEQILIEQNHNLSNLTGICQVNNGLIIKNNNSLNTILGLQSISSLLIDGNNSLSNLAGAEILTNLNSLSIWNCQGLTSLMGMENLNEITSILGIFNCDNLPNLNNLSNLINCPSLSINGCQNLQDINGLSNLAQLSFLEISNNQNLANVNGLSNTASLNLGYIIFENNPNLLSINLNGITSFGSLNIINNPMLNNLNFQTLNAVGPNIVISNCNTLPNLNGLSTATGSTNLTLSNNQTLQNISGLNGLGPNLSLNIDNNDNLTSLAGLENVTNIVDLFIMNNSNLISINGLQNVVELNGQINISNNNNLLNLSGFTGLTSNSPSVIIKNNNQLTSVEGLNNLNNTGYFDWIEIENNPLLQSLDGIYSSTGSYIENYGTFKVINNDNLITLAPLDSIMHYGEFTVIGNAILSECHVWAVCELIDQCNGGCTLTISNNMTGCNSVSEVEALCALVLPVSWLSTPTASIKNSQSYISWSVASQVNNSHFIIEHSTDSKAFSEIGKVHGHGNTSETQDYTYIHETPTIGINYYRIKQIDYDGKYSNSDLASVRYDGDSNINIFPNPTTSEVTITTSEQTTIQILDVYGRLLRSHDITEGQNTVNLSELPSGILIFAFGNQRYKVLKE